MTPTDLAAALERAVAHISPTTQERYPLAGVYVSVRDDLLRDAARVLRRVAAEVGNMRHGPYCRDSYECVCGLDALRRAMGGA